MSNVITLLLAVTLLACGSRPSRESITAGQIGCEPRDIWISGGSSSSGSRDDAETWVAECKGRRFICTERSTDVSTGFVAYRPNGPVYVAPTSHPEEHDVACREELERANSAARPAAVVRASTPRSAPPTGGAGFALGASRESAQQACEGAGKTWDGSTAAQGACSGPAAELGFAASVSLAFCKDRTCGITIQHRPESAWTDAFVGLKQTLVAKYGEPTETKGVVPGHCRSEALFVACLEDGTLRLRFTWTWPSGERINLTAGKPVRGDGDAALRVQYVKARASLAAESSAL